MNSNSDIVSNSSSSNSSSCSNSAILTEPLFSVPLSQSSVQQQQQTSTSHSPLSMSSAPSLPVLSLSDAPPQTPNTNKSDENTVTIKNESSIFSPPTDLLQWKDMPKHLQFNPYVIEGYRPLTNVRGCVNSLLYFHNETINIFTHGKFSFSLKYV